jgi:hypothetical protein
VEHARTRSARHPAEVVVDAAVVAAAEANRSTTVQRLKAAFPSSQAADVEAEAVAVDSVAALRKALCLSRAVSWSA